jgi:hypothetical protein
MNKPGVISWRAAVVDSRAALRIKQKEEKTCRIPNDDILTHGKIAGGPTIILR